MTRQLRGGAVALGALLILQLGACAGDATMVIPLPDLGPLEDTVLPSEAGTDVATPPDRPAPQDLVSPDDLFTPPGDMPGGQDLPQPGDVILPDLPPAMDLGPPDITQIDAAMGQCDPLFQSSCPMGQACAVQPGQFNPSCLTAGMVAPGGTCQVMVDMAGKADNGGCQPGYVCATPPGGGTGPICMQICATMNQQCTDPMTECSGQLPGFDAARERLCIPFTACDILADNACGMGKKCDLGPAPTTECYPDGTIGVGQNCGGGAGGCVSGSVCTSFNGQPFKCNPVCDTNTMMPRRTCAAGTGMCIGLNGYPGIGFCAM